MSLIASTDPLEVVEFHRWPCFCVFAAAAAAAAAASIWQTSRQRAMDMNDYIVTPLHEIWLGLATLRVLNTSWYILAGYAVGLFCRYATKYYVMLSLI